jgi:hypothetical protein
LVFKEFYEEYAGIGPGTCWMMTSPNANWLPLPPKPHRKLQLRADGMFGLDDPINWPQPCVRSYEYIACIRFKDHPSIEFWRRGFGKEDVVELSNHPGYYKIGSYFTKILQSNHSDVHSLVHVFFNALSAMTHGHLRFLAGQFNDAYLLLLKSLEPLPSLTYHLAQVARFAIEIQAYMDYYTIYLPRLSNHDNHEVDSSLMGCFTLTSDLTQEFYKMGIPVWTIRPKDSPYVYNVKLLYAENIIRPTEFSNEPAIGHSIIYDGDSWAGKYLSYLHDWSRHCSLDGSVPSVGESSNMSGGSVPHAGESSNASGGSNNTGTTSKKRKRSSKERNSGVADGKQKKVAVTPSKCLCLLVFNYTYD